MKKLACLMVVAVLLVVSMIPAAAAGINNNEKKIMDYMKTAYVVDGQTITVGDDFMAIVEQVFARDDVDVTDAQYQQIMDILAKALKYCQDNKLVKVGDLETKGASRTLLDYGDAVLKVLGYSLADDGNIESTEDLKSAKGKLLVLNAAGEVVATLPVSIKRAGLAKTGADYSAATVCGFAAVAVLAAASVAVKKYRKETDED